MKKICKREKNIQEIANSNNDSVHDGAHRIDTESPRPRLTPGAGDDNDTLIDAVGRQRHGLGERVARDTVRQRGLAVGSDVAALHVLVEPAGFLDAPRGEEEAADDGEHNEEDACPRVGARALGGPRVGVQRSRRVGLEHHGHHHGVRRVHAVAVCGCGARAFAHIHVAFVARE